MSVSTAQALATDALIPSSSSTSLAASKSEPLDLIINTDAGVDDAAAITWLLTQKEYSVNVLGFSVVAGDTTVDNAANNILTLLDSLGQDIPVVIGAAEPLSEPLSRTGSLLHGADGLWGAQTPHDLSGLSNDVPSFYDDLAQTHPGATLLSLGPLTNLAQTWQEYPDAMKSFEQIIAVGGAKNGGNRTPVAEFNFWQDPEAADELLSENLPITLVPLDAFEEFTLTNEDLQALQTQGTKTAKLIADPLESYAYAQTVLGEDVSVPDLTAVMYALDPSLGTTQSALVKVVTDSDLARGETVIGSTLIERISMIASDAELSELADQASSDPNFNLSAARNDILRREPDNADLVTNIEAERMHDLFLNALIPTPVPEPSSVLGLLTLSAFGAASLIKRKQKMNSQQSIRKRF